VFFDLPFNLKGIPKKERKRIKKDVSRIISTIKNSVKKHSADRDFKRLEWRIDQTKKELLAIANEISANDKNRYPLQK
jgi:hypothetical protein